MLKNGLGHGLFYRPRKDWIEPVTEWISQGTLAMVQKTEYNIHVL